MISEIPRMRTESMRKQLGELKKLVKEPVSPIETANRMIKQFREENRREFRELRRF